MRDLRRRRSGWGIYRWPLLINLIALAGILAALVGNGGWDVFSWLTLGTLSVGVSLTSTWPRANPMHRTNPS